MTRRNILSGCTGHRETCGCATCNNDVDEDMNSSVEDGPYLCGGCAAELKSDLTCPKQCHKDLP